MLLDSFDEETADATYGLLDRGDAISRRLKCALDWYAVVLSNSEAVTLDVRVGACRSALEVLLDEAEETQRVVRAYGRMTRTDETVETTYEDVFWPKGPVQLTPEEWWLTASQTCETKSCTATRSRTTCGRTTATTSSTTSTIA
jgi:hypothetical protein